MRFSFEAILYLLWHIYIPSESQLNIFSQPLKIYRKSPLYAYKLIEKLPTEIDMISKIRTVISSINTNEIKSRPTIDEAIRLTAAMPVIIASLYRIEKNLDFVLPSQEFNHIENYLYMITGKIISSIHSKVLET
ncbi:citrate/2-methylcitrate synthase [Bacillus fungorum]|uniref:citrate/2-methylcitrate synthase n=1 Tax=Bacillus fungorum TaxID=2039284 RepID=UPI001FE43C54|nr:citrate/2-methylcitrate synthase [Bacillus fungorum]